MADDRLWGRRTSWCALVALLLVACGGEPDPSSGEVARLATEITEASWNRGDVDVFSTLMADSIVFHYAGTPRTMSRQEMGAVILRWREAFPDLHMEVEDVIAQGDVAALRLRLSGTQEGEWAGAAPSGKPVQMALMTFMRFEQGRLVELWESDDQLGLLRQLGVDP